MNLLVDPTAVLCKTVDGAYVQSAKGAWEFRGASVHQWLSSLFGQLDGSRSLVELTAGLGPQHGAVLTTLVRRLVDSGIVIESASAGPAWREPGVPAVLGSWIGAPVEAFTAIAAKPVHVVGQGPLADAVVLAARRAGLLAVRPDQDAQVDGHPDGPDRGMAVLSCGVDVEPNGVVYHARAVAAGGAVWIVLPAADGRAPSWESVVRRAMAMGNDLGATDAVSDEVAGVVAARLVREYVLAACAVTSPAEPRILRIDRTSLDCAEHRCLPHPLVEPFGVPAGGHASLPAISRAQFSERAISACDDLLGVVGRPVEGDLVQLPLHVSEVLVSDHLAGRPAVVRRHAGDFATARIRACADALLDYASRMVDPRRFRRGTAGEPLSAGVNLVSGVLRPVHADAAFPRVGRDPAHEPVPVGACAGLSWTDAVLGCLLQWTAELADVDHARPLDETRVNGAARHLLRQLSALGVELVLTDLGAELGAPTVRVLTRGSSTVVSALTTEDAVRCALEQVLAAVQVRRAEPLSRPVVRPRSPSPLLFGDDAEPGASSSEELSAALTTICARFVDRGWLPVAVALDHDPELAAVMPFLARVVLADAH